ncbi:hypothetical protein [Bradyrhizobium sp. SSUT77]|uniref:hypothetical protein n=1 Tax=Bradyrhizobium sp. SSUT77 TaxID=3040603 RepID=UPI00244A9993|nr:hypothetical protein [Bradyrhizobium sp. SSUT77]MDH2346499.1 hypothetical protein [Bradyrhizobium sp. SSUT77]
MLESFGRFEGFVAVIGCGRVDSGPTRHSETALLVTLKGTTDYYTIQWAERGPESDEPPVNDDRWQARLRALSPIELCPILAGEAAPYPSCVNKSCALTRPCARRDGSGHRARRRDR